MDGDVESAGRQDGSERLGGRPDGPVRDEGAPSPRNEPQRGPLGPETRRESGDDPARRSRGTAVAPETYAVKKPPGSDTAREISGQWPRGTERQTRALG